MIGINVIIALPCRSTSGMASTVYATLLPGCTAVDTSLYQYYVRICMYSEDKGHLRVEGTRCLESNIVFNISMLTSSKHK